MVTITKYKDCTVIDLLTKMIEFETYFYNGKELLNTIPDLKECTDFRDNGSNGELLIYKDNQIIYSCTYTEIGTKQNKKEVWNKIIETVYDKTGCLYKISAYDLEI